MFLFSTLRPGLDPDPGSLRHDHIPIPIPVFQVEGSLTFLLPQVWEGRECKKEKPGLILGVPLPGFVYNYLPTQVGQLER